MAGRGNRRAEYESPQFWADWCSLTLEQMAEKYGVSTTAVWLAARKRGFPGKFNLRAAE